MQSFDVAIVGAGAAGMSAAVRLSQERLKVLVLDEGSSPGGQIWRAVDRAHAPQAIEALGPDYRSGLDLVKRFRSSGIDYRPCSTVWHVDRGTTIFFHREGKSSAVDAAALIIATGAQERPCPFPGWTLPGVMTVGAAQILAKTSNQIPESPVCIAGSGPLVLLYATQLLAMGGSIRTLLDTSPVIPLWQKARHLPKAVAASRDILKGMRWMRTLKQSSAEWVRDVRKLRAEGDGRLERVHYTTSQGSSGTVDTGILLVHEGVVPNLQLTMLLDCDQAWDDAQRCFVPIVDAWGETSAPGIFVAGDGAGIKGAKAACLSGEIAALAAMRFLGRVSVEAAEREGIDLRQRWRRETRLRPLLDLLYAPHLGGTLPSDETMVCRCEAVTAGAIREAAGIGKSDPNKVKAATRAGMGPCQGRQCGYTVGRILEESGDAQSHTDLFRIRSPLKPITMGELASLNDAEGET